MNSSPVLDPPPSAKKAAVRVWKKAGSIVVDHWFRESYDAKMEDTLLNTGSRIYGYLRPQAVQQLVKDHRPGWRDHHKILFSLVVLEGWLRAISGQVTREFDIREPGANHGKRGHPNLKEALWPGPLE
jgi:hypothetical protein